MPTTRIPLSWPQNPRTADTTKDSRRVNVMDEIVGDTVYTLKRPGTSLLYTPLPGIGQGMTYYNGATYSVVNDQLAVSSANNSGTSGSNWQSAGVANWTGRSSFSVCNVAGTIYVIGGLIDTAAALNTPSGEVWSITPGTGWQLCTGGATWSPRSEAAVVNFFGDNALLLMGGVTSGPTALNDVWGSPDGVTWTQLVEEAPWAPRYGASAFVSQGTIYLMGGTDGSSVFNDIWVSIDGVNWAELLPAADWPARAFAASYVFPAGGYLPAIWIVGGADVSGNGINDAWYSTDGGKNWAQTGANFDVGGIYAAGFTVYNGQMWLVNGRTGPSVATSINTVYSSVDGNSWSKQSTTGPWQPSCSGGLVVFPTATSVSPYHYQTMYWIGGNNTAGLKSDVVYYGILDLVLELLGDITPPVAGQPYQFAPFQEGTVLLVKNQSGMWVVANGQIKQVISNGYPGETVPGLVVLGSFAYVMDIGGIIHNSNYDNPYLWDLLDAVAADYEADAPVALAKYLNYVVAFGTYTTQFFYDAGKPDASPLLPYLNANSRVGCAAAATVIDLGPTIAWVGRTQQFNRQVFIMEGMTPKPISTPAIDKELNASGWDAVFAFSYYADGHLFYVLSAFTDHSWAFDMSTQRWYRWTDAAGTSALLYSGQASDLSENGFMVQSYLDGKIYRVSSQYYSDNGSPFQVEIVTTKFDAGNNYRKFFGCTTLIGDRNTGMPTIESTDTDYQSYSLARAVDMSTPLPRIFRNGSGRRRAWRIRQQDDNPMRWEALEVAFEQGSVQSGLAGGD